MIGSPYISYYYTNSPRRRKIRAARSRAVAKAMLYGDDFLSLDNRVLNLRLCVKRVKRMEGMTMGNFLKIIEDFPFMGEKCEEELIFVLKKATNKKNLVKNVWVESGFPLAWQPGATLESVILLAADQQLGEKLASLVKRGVKGEHSRQYLSRTTALFATGLGKAIGCGWHWGLRYRIDTQWRQEFMIKACTDLKNADKKTFRKTVNEICGTGIRKSVAERILSVALMTAKSSGNTVPFPDDSIHKELSVIARW